MAADTPFVHLFAGIPTADYDRALPWYERLMGRPPDIVPTAGEAMWTATGTGSIYLVTDPARAGGGTVTVAVSDLDGLLAELTGRGIEPAQVETMAAGRKATVIDAEGNWIAFAELRGGYPLARATARAAATASRFENVAPGPRTSKVRPPSRQVTVLG